MQGFLQNKQAMVGILMWVAVFAAFYFLIIRPQKQKEKKLAEMRDDIQVGDKVVTLAGMIATIAKVGDDDVVIELGPSRTKVPMKKWGIGTVIEKKKDEEIVDVEADKLS